MNPEVPESAAQQPPLPAEACSELGLFQEEQRQHAAWIARWLHVTRCWFGGGSDG